MNKFFSIGAILVLCGSLFTQAAAQQWLPIDADQAPKNIQVMHPVKYLVYKLDESMLNAELHNLSSDPAEAAVIRLPLPDGSFRSFRVWQTFLMPEKLAAKYPEIRSFTGEAIDDPAVTAKLDVTLFGFDAMIYDGDNTSFIDPYDAYHDGYYIVHYKRDETRAFKDRMICEVTGDHISPANETKATDVTARSAARTVNGWNLRTYRLALSADNFYARAATGLPSPTIAQVFSKMTTSMNRVNGVYNREFSVQMNFCANEDTLIWPSATGSINGNDPFNSIDASASSCQSTNQTVCNNRIGAANYDLGHVFTTGAGGLSSLGVVCNNGSKAKSVTGSPTPVGDGFDIDYVSHEMGHEFGGEHTFNNNNDGSCGSNAVSGSAYEPGSGSTIMAYAGICTPDDLQLHSDAYFHAKSLSEIVTLLNGAENVCASISTTGNKLVSLSPFSTSYTIPYKTPFELIAPTAVDSVADTATTYCWEQWNRGDFGSRLINTYLRGPIFRSYNPVSIPTRVFPKMSMVLAGNLSNAGVDNNEGEKAPDTTRYLTFKLTARDIINGNGCVTFPDDTMHVNAVSTGVSNGFGGFKVTSQGTPGITYNGGSNQTVTWNVVGTNAPPVSTDSVTIFMSADGGNTWPYTVGTFPNTGSASFNIPNPSATTGAARFKVKGTGNIFFNVNARNFTVAYNPNVGINGPGAPLTDEIKVFPVPAGDVLHVISQSGGSWTYELYDMSGRRLQNGGSTGRPDRPLSDLSGGIYLLRFMNAGGEQAVRCFVIR